MAKKIIGICLVVVAFLMIMSVAISGNLFADMGSAVETYGYFLGQIIPVITFGLSGVYLFNFDRATNWSFIDGFKKRSKQAAKFVPFIVAYSVLFVASLAGAVMSASGNYWLNFIIGVVLYATPVIIFVSLFQIYGIPHRASKKYFLKNKEALQYYLSGNEKYRIYSEDRSVLASEKAIYFPELFCAIPINQIASVKLEKQLWEQNVYFYLHGGKKICIVTKRYNEIINALKANSPSQSSSC